MTDAISTSFQVGGTLDADHPSYIVRKADEELYQHCLAGEFAYVLSCRQMGKSSLLIRTKKRLANAGNTVVMIDLTNFGSDNLTAEEWYYGILNEVERQCMPKTDLFEWWNDNRPLPLNQRFLRYFEDVLLPETTKAITIFIDEIDTTLGLDFTNDFFTGIRALYNGRANNHHLRRLGFILAGVATPTELISDTVRTPFNIGYSVELLDFTINDVAKLVELTKCAYDAIEGIAARVFYWTRGQPFLTQQLCKLLTSTQKSVAMVDELVEINYLNGKGVTDSHFHFISQYLQGTQKQHRVRLWNDYCAVLKGEEITSDDRSPTHSRLRLAGVVTRSPARKLKVRNTLYSNIFDLVWVKSCLKNDGELKKYSDFKYINDQIGYVQWFFLWLVGIDIAKLRKSEAIDRKKYVGLGLIIAINYVLLLMAWGKICVHYFHEYGIIPGVLIPIVFLSLDRIIAMRSSALTGVVGKVMIEVKNEKRVEIFFRFFMAIGISTITTFFFQLSQAEGFISAEAAKITELWNKPIREELKTAEEQKNKEVIKAIGNNIAFLKLELDSQKKIRGNAHFLAEKMSLVVHQKRQELIMESRELGSPVKLGPKTQALIQLILNSEFHIREETIRASNADKEITKLEHNIKSANERRKSLESGNALLPDVIDTKMRKDKRYFALERNLFGDASIFINLFLDSKVSGGLWVGSAVMFLVLFFLEFLALVVVILMPLKLNRVS